MIITHTQVQRVSAEPQHNQQRKHPHPVKNSTNYVTKSHKLLQGWRNYKSTQQKNIQQHISQQEGGKQGLQEGPCQKATGGDLPSLHSGVPCINQHTSLKSYSHLTVIFFSEHE